MPTAASASAISAKPPSRRIASRDTAADCAAMSDSVRASNSSASGSTCRTAARMAGNAASGSPVVRMNSVTPLPFCRSNGK